MTIRSATGFVLSALLLVLSGCNVGTEHISATQVTARVFIAEEVRAKLAQLRVRSFREDAADFRFRAERSFDKAALKAVVDVALVPSQRHQDGTVLAVVDGLDAQGAGASARHVQLRAARTARDRALALSLRDDGARQTVL